MTRDDYLKAVGSFEPDEDMKRRVLSGMASQPRHRHHVRRALISVLAAVLVLASLTGVAMAASPEVREAVLRFLHLAETEQVPEAATVIGSQPVSGTDIGGRVTAWYLEFENGEGFTTERMRLNSDGTIDAFIGWNFDGKTLTTYEMEPQSCVFELAWRGHFYSEEFYYCVDDGELVVYAPSAGPSDAYTWYVNTLPGRTDTVLLYVSRGGQIDYECYPCLVDIESGKVTDFLAVTGAAKLRYAYEYDFSPDMSRVVILCQDGKTYGAVTGWYCDISSGELTELGELTGTTAKWGSFAADGKLIVSDYTQDTATYWSYDPETGETHEVLRDVPLARYGNEYGLAILNAQTGIYFDTDGSAGVIDLATGERREIENFEYGSGGFLANPDGTKLCYTGRGEDGRRRLGVLDLEAGSFVAFDRAEREDTKWIGLNWFDNDRVMILSRSDSAEYLTLYEVK